MKRLKAVAGGLALLLLSAACTAGPASHRPGEAGPPSRDPRTLTRAPRVVLRADLGARPVRWRPVTSIGFGSGRGRLGLVPAGERTPVPYVPVSFAVAADRSVWILDVVKRRLAHFDHTGRFLGDVRALRFDRFHAHPDDVALVADRPMVLELRPSTLAGVVDVPAHGRFVRTAISADGEALRMVALVPSADEPVGWLSGRALGEAGEPRRFPSGYAELDVPGTGEARLLDGMPLGDGVHARLDPKDDGDFEAWFVAKEERSVLPLRIEVSANGRRIAAELAASTATALRHGFASFIQLAPSGPSDARRYGGGRWLLALFDDGSPMIWERLPQPAFDDELVARHVTVGPGDALYLMEVDAHGVTILRRPR
ncbi:MAG: hypothetical protein ABR600_00745 [Actinomycetota bacterium]